MESGVICEGLDEILRQRLNTLSEKNEAKDSARDGMGIVDDSEVMCLRCNKEFMFLRMIGPF